jgi:hypothetical protein
MADGFGELGTNGEQAANGFVDALAATAKIWTHYFMSTAAGNIVGLVFFIGVVCAVIWAWNKIKGLLGG